MEIRFRCPACAAPVDFENPAAHAGRMHCPKCTKKIDLDLSEAFRSSDTVDRCPCCGSFHLYSQKDFNQKLGLGIAVLAGLLGLVFVALDRPLGFYLALLSAVIVDAFLYLVLPKVTICYSCRSEFRGFVPHPDHGPFDLKIAEVYDRKRGGSEVSN